MKKGRHDPFPAELFRAEMDGVRMSADEKMRALSRMKGERQMVRRTGYALVAAMLLLMLTAGGTLAMQNRDADQPDEDRLVLSDTSVVIPAQNGADAAVFTLTDALYDGESILIAYKLENGTQLKYDVPEDMLPEPMFPLEGLESGYDQALYRYLSERIAWKDAPNAVGYNWLQIPPGTVDGTSISSWYDWDAMTVDDMHYLWIRLRHEIDREYSNGLLEVNPDEQIPQENIWLNRDEITLQFSLCLEETALAIAPDGQEMWFDNLTGGHFELPPITIARTDEMEKRTVAEGVIQLAEDAFFIPDTADAPAAVLTIHELSYDGSSIFLEYSAAGEAKTRLMDREDLEGRYRYALEPDHIRMMNQTEAQVYSMLLNGGHQAVSGLCWTVDEQSLMDANGKSMHFYIDASGTGSTMYDPLSGTPDRHHIRLFLNVTPDGEGVGDHLARQQTLIDKEEISVMLPLQLENVIMTQEDGKVMYVPTGMLDEGGVAVPVTVSRSENKSVSEPWTASLIGGMQHLQVWPRRWGFSGMYMHAQLQDETHEELLTVFVSGTVTRAYNAESDIAVRLLAQAEDPYGYLAWAQRYLDMDIDVNSVLLRMAVPGTPTLKDGIKMDAYLDVCAAYDELYGRWNWTYEWKEDADSSAFAGMETVEIQIPVTEARIYARYDDRGRIFAGMESIPVPGDSLTVQLPLP